MTTPHTFDKFYLLTIPHGRKGVIPYEYPPASADAATSNKLPRHSDIINFCFPDLDEIRKARSLDFKAPLTAPTGSALGSGLATIGAQIGGGGGAVASPLAPPSLAGNSSNSNSSSYTGNTSPSTVGGGGLATSKSGIGGGGGSYVGSQNNAASGFRSEFYTFTLTEADGSRIFGMVYRCLPSGFGMRYDVGKRFPECLCFLTRYPQAQPMFQQVLQQVHALRLMYAPIAKIETLLGGLYHRPLPVPGETILLKQGLSAGVPAQGTHTRSYRYTWPAEGEVPASDALATLYLFQQLKPKAFVMLLSAMLCERRICFIASEMDKLSACVHAAVGLLYPFTWQHVFIPVLPGPLATYACAPVPIIFGIRRQQLPLLSKLPLEDLIYIDLDAGELSWSGDGPCPVPDIYVLPNTSQVVQAAQKLGAEAAKAAEKLDKAFNKGLAFLNKYTGQQLVKEADEPKPDAANVLAWELSLMAQSRASNPITWSGKAKPSKTEKNILSDEQQLRDALLIFFVNIAGDASTYLHADRSGKLLLDRDFYIGSRGMLGDGPHLSNFLLELVQSQLFERFAETRKAQLAVELGGGSAASSVSSPRGGATESAGSSTGPFFKCVETVKARGETFSMSNIKKALKAQQQLQQQQLQQAQQEGMAGAGGVEVEQTSGRWTVFHETALQLTSSSATGPPDPHKALQILVEDSYSSTLLPSILRVIWNRLGDCKGLKWRHAHKSLLLLRELLIRGPEAVLSETLSNITTLRTFLEYKAGVLGGNQGNKVREVAQEMFFVLLDGRQVMLQRSVYWSGKKKMAQPRLRLSIEHALSTSFEDLHRVVAPTNEGPSSSSSGGVGVAPARSMSTSRSGSGAPPPDLLSSESVGNADDELMPPTDASAFTTEPEEGEEEQQQQQQQQNLQRASSSSYTPPAVAVAPVQQPVQPVAVAPNTHTHSTPLGAQPSKPQWETFTPTFVTRPLTPPLINIASATTNAPTNTHTHTGALPSDVLPPIQAILSPTAAAQQQAKMQQTGVPGAGARVLSPGEGGVMVMQPPPATVYDPFSEIESQGK